VGNDGSTGEIVGNDGSTGGILLLMVSATSSSQLSEKSSPLDSFLGTSSFFFGLVLFSELDLFFSGLVPLFSGLVLLFCRRILFSGLVLLFYE